MSFLCPNQPQSFRSRKIFIHNHDCYSSKFRPVVYEEYYENSLEVKDRHVLPEPIACTLAALENIRRDGGDAFACIEHIVKYMAFHFFNLLELREDIESAVAICKKPEGINETLWIRSGGKLWEKTYLLLDELERFNALPWTSLRSRRAGYIFFEMLLERDLLIPGLVSSEDPNRFFSNVNDWHEHLRSKNTKLKSDINGADVAVQFEGVTGAVLKAGYGLAEKNLNFCDSFWKPLIKANSEFLHLSFKPAKRKGKGRKANSRCIMRDGKKIRPGRTK